MKSIIKRILASTLLVAGLAFGITAFAGGASVSAIDCSGTACINDGINSTGDGTTDGPTLDGVFKTVVNVLLYVIGAISVIMLIIGGIRYTISGGNSTHVTAAKNTIMYALIGLIIAFLAYAIINWVLTSIGG